MHFSRCGPHSHRGAILTHCPGGKTEARREQVTHRRSSSQRVTDLKNHAILTKDAMVEGAGKEQ